MGEDNTVPPRPSDAKRSADRRVKLIFFVVVIVIASVAYYFQRQGPALSGWGDNLDAALKRSRQDDRPVLVLFFRDPPSETFRKLKKSVLDKSASVEAMAKGKFIRVKIKLNAHLDSNLAKTYQIRELPTMLIIGPDGKERNRRKGYIAFADFWSGFLDCSKIETATDS